MNDDEATRVLQKAADEAAARAAVALGQMVGHDLSASARVLSGAPGVPPPPSEGEQGAIFRVEDVEGCTFVVSFSRTTLSAVRELMAPGTDEAAMPDSMIALEVANICASHFLNTIGDLIDRRLLPSPPAPLTDAPRAEGHVIEAKFRSAEGVTFGGAFHFVPGNDITRALHGSTQLR